MAGHLFVVQSDLTHLACDDWLLPTDDALHVTPPWWKADLVAPLREVGAWRYDDEPTPDPQVRKERITPLRDDSYTQPRPWLVSVQGDPVENAEKFVRAAAKAGTRRFLKRERRLLALPVIGTGWGGMRAVAGDVLTQLVPRLAHVVANDKLAADVVVVTHTAADYAAAQHARRQCASDQNLWAALPKRLVSSARLLAELAAQGRLVLFLGAGIGAGAGLPLWEELLQKLGERAGVSPKERTLYGQLGELDRAEYVAQRLRSRGTDVGTEVSSILAGYQRPGLAHCLVAGLPCKETVTTNYDTLFERACEDLNRPAAVLPYAPATEAQRWLLKMHGCVHHGSDIVLTRQNYLRYAERNAALAGIVQAMLITKHMLFLGFSLRDDNFLRIVDQVRQAVHPSGVFPEGLEHRLGTALMLFNNPLLADLWRNEIDWVCLGEENCSALEAARLCDVYLDYISFQATSQSHLLDPRFEGVLSPEDLALRKLLRPLLRSPLEARKSLAWPLVRDLLVRLGGALERNDQES